MPIPAIPPAAEQEEDRAEERERQRERRVALMDWQRVVGHWAVTVGGASVALCVDSRGGHGSICLAACFSDSSRRAAHGP